MVIHNALTFGHTLLENVLENGDSVIDATVGNGHDTLFLANLIGQTGCVYGFDIQKQAIESTEKRLIDHQVYNRVKLYQQSHDAVEKYIPESEHGNLKAAVFNLGYLPGGNKQIVTEPDSTIQAVETILQLLQIGGIIVLLVYQGHQEGKTERDRLLQYVDALDQRCYSVLKYELINQRNNPPFLLAVEKKH